MKDSSMFRIAVEEENDRPGQGGKQPKQHISASDCSGATESAGSDAVYGNDERAFGGQ